LRATPSPRSQPGSQRQRSSAMLPETQGGEMDGYAVARPLWPLQSISESGLEAGVAPDQQLGSQSSKPEEVRKDEYENKAENRGEEEGEKDLALSRDPALLAEEGGHEEVEVGGGRTKPKRQKVVSEARSSPRTTPARAQRKVQKRPAEEDTAHVSPKRRKVTAQSEASPGKGKLRGMAAARNDTPRPRPQRVTASTRTRQKQGAIRVIASGVLDKGGKEMVRRLGGNIADDVSEGTHLVLSDTKVIPRRVKILRAICEGKHVVDFEWLSESISAGRFLPEERHTPESLKKPLQRAQTRRLLDEYEVYCTPSIFGSTTSAEAKFTPDMTPARPPRGELEKLVESAGGTLLETEPPSGVDPQHLLVLSCAEDKATWAKFKGPVYSLELLWSGCLNQKLSLREHLLKR